MEEGNLAAALKMLQERMKNMPQRPDAFFMNWSTWCLCRRMLKQHGIPITYRQVGYHRWTRFVEGVAIHVRKEIEGDDIISLTSPRTFLDYRNDPFPHLGMTRALIRRYHLFDI